MKIHIVTTAYNLPDATRKMVCSASGEPLVERIHLFQNSPFPEIDAVCEQLRADVPNLRHYPIRHNRRGLAWAWNDGVINAYAEGADVVLIANDDIEFGPGCIEQLAQAAMDQPETFIVTCRATHAQLGPDTSIGYSCFVLTRSGFDKLGCFDQNYFPIYCEDSDHFYRAVLMGLNQGSAGLVDLLHGGSAHLHGGLRTTEIRARNAHTQEKNHDYHTVKWGGTPGRERYTLPFNSPRFDLRIAPEVREDPYPGHGRYDRYIVTI